MNIVTIAENSKIFGIKIYYKSKDWGAGKMNPTYSYILKVTEGISIKPLSLKGLNVIGYFFRNILLSSELKRTISLGLDICNGPHISLNTNELKENASKKLGDTSLNS